ncbi:hypothetical protein RSAG8_00399, partial [Rhizoctonia solani AG-8 WAC10335]
MGNEGGVFTVRMPAEIRPGRVSQRGRVRRPPRVVHLQYAAVDLLSRPSSHDLSSLIGSGVQGPAKGTALRSHYTHALCSNKPRPLHLPCCFPPHHTMTTRWIPRTPTFDDESDHQPSPINPMYHEHSPADNWLSPAMTSNDDVDMIFELDWNRPDVFCSLLDDTASRREQQALLTRWQTPVYSMPSMTKANALSRQPTLHNVVIASEWEEKLIRRWQRKNKKQHLSLREVKSQMPPLEFDPAFADSDTEDEDDEPAFNPESLREPLMRPVPAPIAIPPTYSSSAPLSPLTPLSSEPPQSAISQAERSSPTQAPAVAPESAYAPPTPMSPVVKQEAVDDVLSSRASPAIKRPFDEVDPEVEGGVTEVVDDVVSEGEYMPSEDEEDDADPTYGAPRTRRASQSTHARTPSSPEKPARTPSLLGDTWDGTLGKPTCEGCGTEFSRRDAVKRHQNEVKAKFDNGRCVWCPGTQGRKGSAKRVALAKVSSQTPTKKQRRK